MQPIPSPQEFSVVGAVAGDGVNSLFQCSPDSLADIAVAELCRSIKARVVQVDVDALAARQCGRLANRPEGRSNRSANACAPKLVSAG